MLVFPIKILWGANTNTELRTRNCDSRTEKMAKKGLEGYYPRIPEKDFKSMTRQIWNQSAAGEGDGIHLF